RQRAGVPGLERPTARPRAAVQSFRGSARATRFSVELCESLVRLSRDRGVTLFMTLLAGFTAFLARITGREDLAVGSPIAGRNRREIEELIGFFVNTLVLRNDLSGDPGFRELLGRVRRVALDAYAHQDLPFDYLVEELEPERDLSSTPLFQVMFTVQNAPQRNLELPGLTLRPAAGEGATTTAKFDLTLALQESETVLVGGVEYSTDLFDATTIDRWLGHFARLLAAAVADPERRISELPLLGSAERHELLREWTATDRTYPREASLRELVEARVRERPEAVAAVFDRSGAPQASLSYAELNARANRLAHHLRRLGVGPETRVGLSVERSLELIVATLGIIKAGGAYVPLDPTYPDERLAFMVDDSGAAVVLSDGRMAERLRGLGVESIDLDREWPAIAACPDTDPVAVAGGGNLAYVIYTSGSTGRAKGVTVPQRAISRLVLNTDYVALRADDRIAQASNASFDAATFEIWGALLNGATLVGIERFAMLSPRSFADELRTRAITTLFITTALFDQLARETPAAFAPLRHLLFGGEAVDPRRVREVVENAPPRRLLHVYGPTESTTFATWQRVTAVAADAVTVPIGRALANTRLTVLDRRLRPVPIGVPGELCLGGDGLAREYHARPALTAASLVPDPASGLAGARLYRTGDRVRLGPGGAVEFLGRIDDQVKIRGFRIEPGELAAVLARHPAVREAVAVVRADEPGSREKRLVGYAVPEEGAAIDVAELLAFVRERLPEYMVPAALVPLERLPLTPNGKVDRGALPEPEWGRGETAERVAPRTP
ncbi:MAG: amino acid adenylation domain-containing protein, partial [bacterium]|nr:amino acid adenylation domain-containing protein [bacterium]